MKLGQVAGVSVGGGGEVVIFHRGDHVWDSQSFNMQNQFLEKDLGPISSPTVLVFHPDTGALLHEWGESMWVEIIFQCTGQGSETASFQIRLAVLVVSVESGRLYIGCLDK